MIQKTPVALMLMALVATTTAHCAEAQPASENASVIELRAEARQLEQNMYNIFNGLNSSDDLDVTCGEKAPTGSTIPTWQCTAAFMANASSTDVGRRFDNSASRSDNFGYAPQSSKQLAFNARKKTQQLNDEMKSLAQQHPELASAMLALHAKRQQVEALEK